MYDDIRLNILKAIRDNNVTQLMCHLPKHEDISKIYHGMTLLDIALIDNRYAVAKYLNEAGCQRMLSDEQVTQHRQQKTRQLSANIKHQIEIKKETDGSFTFEVAVLQLPGKECVKRTTLNSLQWQEIGFRQDNLVVCSYRDEVCIAISEPNNPLNVQAIFRIDEHGHTYVMDVKNGFGNISLNTANHVILEGNLSIEDFLVEASHLVIEQGARLESQRSHFIINGDAEHKGFIIANNLNIRCHNFKHIGQSFSTEQFSFDIQGRFEQSGSLLSRLSGSIKANAIENVHESTIQVLEGKLKLFGKAYLKNAGVIVSDYLTLDSRHMITNYYGALIKAVTCIVPPKGSQFNNAGFYFVGRKSNQTAWDYGLNFVGTAINVAGMFSLLPTNHIKNLQNALLMTKTLYRGADLFQRVYYGNAEDISTEEWVHYFLNHIIPALGMLVDEESKSNLICNVLYQIWGTQLGEHTFIEQSIGLLELIVSCASHISHGYLSEQDITTLEIAAKAIKFSKSNLKYAQSSAEILTAFYQDDKLKMQNAQDTLSAMIESLARDLLYTIEPKNIFNLEVNPRDLVLFFLNKGHEQNTWDCLQRGVYASLYALHKSELLTDVGKADLQYAAHLVFSLKTASNIHEKYQKGDLTYTVALEQILSQVTVLASHRALKQQLQEKAKQAQLSTTTIDEDNEETKAVGDESLKPSDEITKSNDEVTVEVEDVLVDVANLEDDNISDVNDIEPGSSEVDEDILTPPTPAEIKEMVDDNASQYYVEYDRPSVTLNIDVEKIVEDMFNQPIVEEAAESPAADMVDEPTLPQDIEDIDIIEETSQLASPTFFDNISITWQKGMKPEYAQALCEFSKLIRGDAVYAESGYLGVFSSTLHNEGMINSAGNIVLRVDQGHNANHIQASQKITLQGSDVRNRDNEGSIINKDLDSQALSEFVNESWGTMQSGGELSTRGMGSVKNKGNLYAERYQNMYGTKSHINEGQLVAREELEVVSDQRALNTGTLSGKKILHEGTTEESVNAGKVFAEESIRHVSEKKAHQTESGHSVSHSVTFESDDIHKEGDINAAIVKTIGYGQPNPESITWHTGDDSIIGLILNPKSKFEYDADAFNNVKLTDLQLNGRQLDQDQLLNLDSEFNNVLQLQVPDLDKTILTNQLPQLHADATFILWAPGATLDATQIASYNYNSTLHFLGQSFTHQGHNTFNRGCFDVEQMQGIGGESYLELTNGGAIQAHDFSNEGRLHSGGALFWNVDKFTNDAQIQEHLEQYIHSKQTYVYDYHYDQLVVEGSGTIHSKSNVGYIGELNEVGGKFTSGDGGNHLYIKNSKLVPLFSLESCYTRGVIEDIGRSWHVMPKSHEAEIGSSGVNLLLGTGELNAFGAKIWGDEGNHIHFNEGINETVDSRTYVIEEALSKSGYKKQVVIPRTEGVVTSINDIASNNGPLTLASANGSINLTKTTISCPGDAAIVAKQDVTINGQQVTRNESYAYSEHSLLGKKKYDSQSNITEVDSSYLFIGGNLLVSCLEFNLMAVSGMVGNMDVTAMTTRLSGAEASYSNKTITQSVSIGLPTDKLVSILSNHNARGIFASLVQNCGWEPAELDALLNAKSVEEIPGHLVATAKNVWDITALVAHACNELGEGNPKEFVDSITDQLGLTTINSEGAREFSTKVRLNWSKTKETTEHSQTIASNLYIGGTFKLFGNKLIIADGSKIDAKDLLIALAEGIEMTASKESYKYSSTTKAMSLGVDLLNPKNVDVSGSKSHSSMQSDSFHLAALTARESAQIKTGQYIRGQGKITANNGEVIAPEILLSSLQNTYQEKNKSVGGSVSTDLSSVKSALEGNVGFNFSNGRAESAITEDKAGIFIKDGVVKTNHAHLENGSIIQAKQFLREDDAQGVPLVTGTAAYDYKDSTQAGFSMQSSMGSGEFFGKANQTADKQAVTHNPSVYAQNVAPGSWDGINTDTNQESIETRSSHSGFSMAVYKPNPEKLDRQVHDIVKAGNSIGTQINKGIDSLFGQDDLKTNKEAAPVLDFSLEQVEQQVDLAHRIVESTLQEALADDLEGTSYNTASDALLAAENVTEDQQALEAMGGQAQEYDREMAIYQKIAQEFMPDLLVSNTTQSSTVQQPSESVISEAQTQQTPQETQLSVDIEKPQEAIVIQGEQDASNPIETDSLLSLLRQVALAERAEKETNTGENVNTLNFGVSELVDSIDFMEGVTSAFIDKTKSSYEFIANEIKGDTHVIGDSIIAVDKFLTDQMMKLYQGEATVIHQGVSTASDYLTSEIDHMKNGEVTETEQCLTDLKFWWDSKSPKEKGEIFGDLAFEVVLLKGAGAAAKGVTKLGEEIYTLTKLKPKPSLMPVVAAAAIDESLGLRAAALASEASVLGEAMNSSVWQAEKYLFKEGAGALGAASRGVQKPLLFSPASEFTAGITKGTNPYNTLLAESARVGQQTERLTKGKIINYLENVGNVPREQLVKDLESIGLKYNGGSIENGFLKFNHKEHKGKFNRVEIHSPHSGKNAAQYDHLHIFDKKKNPLDWQLQIVDRKSTAAHIQIKPNDKLFYGVKPK